MTKIYTHEEHEKAIADWMAETSKSLWGDWEPSMPQPGGSGMAEEKPRPKMTESVAAIDEAWLKEVFS